MSVFTLQNNILKLEVSEKGAELTSILHTLTNTEYLWNGDPAFWKYHSPILFPLVGSLKNKTYTHQGKTYSLPQHGFAREMRFELTSQTTNELFFSLESNEETRKGYPFDFRLDLGYRLEDNQITVIWRVRNNGKEDMFFSIGGHPAFQCPLNTAERQSEHYIQFDTDQPVHYLLVDDNGQVVKKPLSEQHTLTTEDGFLPIYTHLFDHGALIIEEKQYCRISLATPDKKPYLTVSFDAPLFGLWSPAKKNAPFVCIEPWYGRCDASDFNGGLEEREYGNHLKPDESFETSYTILIHEK